MSLLTEKRGRLEHVGKELKRLSELEALTGEQTTELDTYMAEWDALLPEVERLHNAQQRATEAARMQQSTGTVTAAEALAQSGEGEKGRGGATITRPMGPGETFAKSDAVKAFVERGEQKHRVPITYDWKTYQDRTPLNKPSQAYTQIDSADLPGFMVPPMVVPDIKRPRDYTLTARDVFVNARTTADTIYFIRELVFTNAAAETAEATSFSVSALGTGGGLKPESALTFEEASVPVRTIAHWIPITRQAIQDTAQLQSYVENRLLVGLERRFNSEIWNGDGTGVNITGLMNTTGVQEIDDTDFATAPVMNDGTQNENFERVLRGVTEVELTGDAQATFLAMNPRDLEKFRTVTDDNRLYLAGGPFNEGAIPRMWSYPIASDRGVPEGHVVVGDGTMAAIFDREDAAIFIDTINDQFVRNQLTILAEMRAAFAVFRPAAFADVTLKAWA